MPDRKRGRPSVYSDALCKQICKRIMSGESLRKITRDDAMPAMSTVCNWILKNKEFLEHYTHAREVQADILADELIDIADRTADDVQRDRLRVDTRKWVASKLLPKRFGDRVETRVANADGENIIPDNRQLARAIVDILGSANIEDVTDGS